MSKEVKNLLAEEVNEALDDTPEAVELQDHIQKYPTCGVGIPLELEEIKQARGGKTRVKRTPSAYNQFISKCMKEDGIKKFSEAAGKMKACALEWKKEKGKL